MERTVSVTEVESVITGRVEVTAEAVATRLVLTEKTVETQTLASSALRNLSLSD